MKNVFKTAIIGCLISALVFALLFFGLVIFDLALHSKFDKRSALNYRGYRGKVAGKKAENEVRVGIFGGSAAMGYGEPSEYSIASYLEKILNTPPKGKKYTVLNLAATGERHSACFEPAYRMFKYLDIDVIIFYFWGETVPPISDRPKADEIGKMRAEFFKSAYTKRTDNWILKYFRYYFIFPTVLVEKYYMLRYGNIEKGYKEDKLFKAIVSVPQSFEIKNKEEKSFYQFVKGLADSGKLCILALAPSEGYQDSKYWDELKRYFHYVFMGNPKVVVCDLSGAFSNGASSDYFVDNEHYSRLGNGAIAKALSKYVQD